MKKEAAHKLLEEGYLGFIAEYRGSKAETINYMDKKSGKAASMNTLRHNLELGETAIAFNERVDDAFKVTEYKQPYKKGQKVLVFLTSLQNDKGVTRASGRIEALE